VVEKNIFHAERNRPSDLPGGGYSLTEGEIAHLVAWADAISGPSMSAEDAAKIVMDAIEAGWLHVAPNGTAGSARAREQLLADLERA
jgi:hypothetical protein